jgi:hypothetical protein
MGIPILTFSVASALIRRYFSNRSLSQCQIKWSTISLSPAHTHIRSSTILNQPRCNRTEQCPHKKVNLLFYFLPSTQGQSVTSGKIEWVNLPVSTGFHFTCHALISAGLAKLWKSLGWANTPKKLRLKTNPIKIKNETIPN